MKKFKLLIFVITAFIMLSSFRCLAFNHGELYMDMEIPDSFEKIDDVEDNSIDVYINIEQGQQISILSKFNFDDISYSDLSDAEIWQIERDADSIFIPEGSNNYFLSDPEATRVYTNSVDGGKKDGVRIRACYFDTSTNMETYSTVYLFSVESYYYAIAFMSYDNSEYWYKSCLDSLVIGDKYAKYTSSAVTDTSSDNKKSESKSGSDFSLADFFEHIGRIGAIVVIMYLGRSVIRKKK